MKRYLEYYENEWPENIEELRAVENKPFVGYLNGGGIKYTVIPKPADPNTYVTFTAQKDNSSIGLYMLSTNQTLEYSTDTITWNTFDTTTNISLNNEDKVYVRGVLNEDNTYDNYTQFEMSGKIAASGNCNAIWNYQNLHAPLKAYCGYRIFFECTSLTTAPELPATVLADSCYESVFDGCTNLTTVPELPATTLTNKCYKYMFYQCASLTTVPELPATTLADYCYAYMFYGCASLTTSPELPATELSEGCYYCMFYTCTSLTTVPELPATTLVTNCYAGMFDECTSLTTAPELPATTLAPYCYHCMFYGCASLTTSPELPATTLAEGCYREMFVYCNSLTVSPELPATTLTVKCYYCMFYGCTKLNHIKCLATNKPASDCTASWVYKVSSTGTFVKHPDMTSWSTGTNGIPSGWTVVDAEL